MTERPILFSAPMVRAILDGTKTQTRRVVKCAPDDWAPMQPQRFAPTVFDRHGNEDAGKWTFGSGNEDGDCWITCPYGQPGDRLWVRESFAVVPRTAYRCSAGVQQTLRPDDDHDAAIYREGWTRSRGGFRWRPSIHMPRWASRITLEVTGVRVERLQDISVADATAEGVVECAPNLRGLEPCMEWRYAYEDLWKSIIGPGSWDANPWVWCVSFRRIDAS